jgi:hypothetical protein
MPTSLLSGLDFTKIFAENGLLGVLTNIINLLFWVAGIVSVIFIIVGGIMYIVSAGNENSTIKAKNTILWAVIGLIISLASIGITTFIITRLGGTVSS